MGQSPFDIVSQRHSELQARANVDREIYNRERVRKCMIYFYETLAKFTAFVKKHGYPDASPMEFEGQRCVAYKLYWTTGHEGETYFEGSPLTLLINEREQVLYVHATSSNGYYSATDSDKFVVRFEMPKTYDEYVAASELPYRKSNSGSAILNGDDMLTWAALLEYFMDSYRRYGYYEEDGFFGRNQWTWDHRAQFAYIREVRERVLPEGETYELYVLHRRAK